MSSLPPLESAFASVGAADESGSDTASESQGEQAPSQQMAWELPAPRFGPFEPVTFQQLEMEWQQRHPAGAQHAQPQAAGLGRNRSSAPVVASPPVKVEPAGAPKKAASRKKASAVPAEAPSLPADLPPAPLSFEDMLEKPESRANWFGWAKQVWSALKVERSKRLTNRVYKMKMNQPPPPMPLPPPATVPRAHVEGAMKKERKSGQLAQIPPQLLQQYAAPPTLLKNNRAVPAALPSRLHMPPPLPMPPPPAPRPPAPILKEDTLHPEWNTKPLPAVSASVRSSAEHRVFSSFPASSLSSALMLWDFLHLYAREVPLDFPWQDLTLQSFLEAILVESLPVPLPPQPEEGDEEEVAAATLHSGSTGTSPQKRRDGGAESATRIESALGVSPMPMDGHSRAETPAVPATGRSETPAPPQAAPAAGTSVSPSPHDHVAVAPPAAAASEPAVSVKLENTLGDVEMKDVSDMAAATNAAAAAVLSPSNGESGAAAASAASSAAAAASPVPAVPSLPPLLRPCDLRESHLLNSVMAVIVRCLFFSNKSAVSDYQRVVNRLTWPEHLRQWLISEEASGLIRGLKDVSGLLSVDSFYYLAVPKRMQLLDALLEHILSGEVGMELIEGAMHALAAAKLAHTRTKQAAMSSKKQQERDMMAVAETLYALLEQVVSPNAQSSSDLSVSVALNARNGLATQGLRMLQDNYEAQREKSARSLVELEASFPVRTEPLGMDRYKNRYWALACTRRPGVEGKQPPDRLFVELCGTQQPPVVGASAAGVSADGSRAFSWIYYSTHEEFKQLLQFLNPYGTRERALKEALLRVQWPFVPSKADRKAAAAAAAIVKAENGAAAPSSSGVKMEGVEANADQKADVKAAAPSPLSYTYASCMALNLPLLRASEILRKADSESGPMLRCVTCQDALPVGQRHCPSCHRTWDAHELSENNFSAHSALCARDGGKNFSSSANAEDPALDAAEREEGFLILSDVDARTGYSDRRLFAKRVSRPLTILDEEGDAPGADEEGAEKEVELDEDEYEPVARAETPAAAVAEASGAATPAADVGGDGVEESKMDTAADGDASKAGEPAPPQKRVERRFKRLTPQATCLSDVSYTFQLLKAMLFDVETAIPLDAVRRSGKAVEKARQAWLEPLKLTHSLRFLARSMQALAENLKPEWVRSWLKLEDWSRAVSHASTEAQLAALLFTFDKALLYTEHEKLDEERRGKSGDGPVRRMDSDDEDAEMEDGGGEDAVGEPLAGCMICQRTDKPNRALTCETCEREVHMSCLKPPLKHMPKGRFDCPSCRRRILREIKRGRNMVEAQQAAAKLARIHNARESRKARQRQLEGRGADSKIDSGDLPNGGVCVVCNVDEGDPLLCDSCNNAHHMRCLPVPLKEAPEGEWFCPACVASGNDHVAPTTPVPSGRSKKGARKSGGGSGRRGRGGGRGGGATGRRGAKRKLVEDEAEDEAEESDDASEEHEMSATGRVIYKTDSEAEEDEDESDDDEEAFAKPAKAKAPAKGKGKSAKASATKAKQAAARARAAKRRKREEEEEDEEEDEEEEESSTSSSSSSSSSEEDDAAAEDAAESSSSTSSSSSSSDGDDEDGTSDEEAEDQRCTVCFNKREAGRIECDGCNVVAHSACIGPAAASTPWICSTCSLLGSNDAQCELCPFARKDAVMVPLSDSSKGDALVHQCCAEWTTGLSWNADKTAARGTAQLDPAKQGQLCRICSKTRGYTVSCGAAGCADRFHVLCALRKGGYTLTKEASGVRCAAHTSKK